MAGENQHHCLVTMNEGTAGQLFQACERHGGSRFTANSFGADLDFGNRDLFFADILARSLGCIEHTNCFLPGSGIADANGCRHGFGLNCDQLAPSFFAQGPDQSICTASLNDGDLWQSVDLAEFSQFEESLSQSRGVGEVTSRHDHMIWYAPSQLFEHLDRCGLLSFQPIRIN